MCYKIILVQRFCRLKVKITQFPDGFLLNMYKWPAASFGFKLLEFP